MLNEMEFKEKISNLGLRYVEKINPYRIEIPDLGIGLRGLMTSRGEEGWYLYYFKERPVPISYDDSRFDDFLKLIYLEMDSKNKRYIKAQNEKDKAPMSYFLKVFVIGIIGIILFIFLCNKIIYPMCLKAMDHPEPGLTPISRQEWQKE